VDYSHAIMVHCNVQLEKLQSNQELIAIDLYKSLRPFELEPSLELFFPFLLTRKQDHMPHLQLY